MIPNHSKPNFLLVNPPIYDFAAHDLWSKPLGLLYLASILKNAGGNIHIMDCLDRFHPLLPANKSNAWGCGHYFSKEIPKPACLQKIPRKYKRYGLPEELFVKNLENLSTPDVIMVTSGMTYWYLGVFEAIHHLKKRFPKTPLILGGTYATLCYEHAKAYSGADYIVQSDYIRSLKAILDNLGIGFDGDCFPMDFSFFPEPMYENYRFLEYIAFRTTMGCPFRCTYCAIDLLAQGKWQRKAPSIIVQEILKHYKKGIKNFAFYDDALFVDSDNHIIPILEEIQKYAADIFFHSPNGLHARYVTPRLANVLKKSGFIQPRLSLETVSIERQTETGGKINNEQFLAATKYLKEAGYKNGGYLAYIMIGMPGQEFSEIYESIEFAHKAGAKVSLPEYSPIPGTHDWEKSKNLLPSNDPLWQNNSVYPLFSVDKRQQFQYIKDLTQKRNKCFT